MDVPDVRYARAGGVAVAFQVVGEGTRTLVYSPARTNLYTLWLSTIAKPFLDRLSQEMRLIVINPRGTGLSDRPRNVTLEARMDDVNAVLDAIGIERAALYGAAESANVCALYAATYPDRCERLALFSPYARSVRSDSYPYGRDEEEWRGHLRDVRDRWGDRDFLEEAARLIDPAIVADERVFDWWVWYQRLSLSPMAAVDFARMQMDTDITDVLGSIRVPTLVLHDGRNRGQARYVADRIPRAEAVELGGRILDGVLRRSRGRPPCVRAWRGVAGGSRFGACDGALHGSRRLYGTRDRSRRPAVARAPSTAPRERQERARTLPWDGGRHRR